MKRFFESSPLVPPIIDLFCSKFLDAKYDDINKPEDTNGLHAIEIYKLAEATPLPSPSVHLQIRAPSNIVLSPSEASMLHEAHAEAREP